MHAIALLITLSSAHADLHPAFVKEKSVLEAAWLRGVQDAPRKRTADDALNKFRKGIGKIRTAPLVEETVSWLYYFPPEVAAYYYGFTATKQYWSEEERAEVRKAVVPETGIYLQNLVFYGRIVLMPSFGGAYGSIDRHADPGDLAGVRIVLKVGDKIVQPIEQPGDLLQAEGTASNVVSVPRYDYETARVSAYGTGGYATANVSTVRHYTTYHEQRYNWYVGEFTAVFPLFDAEGNPHITAADKEIEVIVIYGPNERRAKYSLKDLTKVF